MTVYSDVLLQLNLPAAGTTESSDIVADDEVWVIRDLIVWCISGSGAVSGWETFSTNRGLWAGELTAGAAWEWQGRVVLVAGQSVSLATSGGAHAFASGFGYRLSSS